LKLADLRNSWKKGADYKRNRPNKSDTLATLIGKQVILITRNGHWIYGTLRDVDNRGILLTGVSRIEPKVDAEGNPLTDTSRMVALRRMFPFELPVEMLGDVVVRKVFVAWGHVAQIMRAKTKDEIEKEGDVNG
jgi:small nuclear ribonucleoprotein (snRNP)-like protein